MKATCPSCGYTVRASHPDDAPFFDAGKCPECGHLHLVVKPKRRSLSQVMAEMRASNERLQAGRATLDQDIATMDRHAADQRRAANAYAEGGRL